MKLKYSSNYRIFNIHTDAIPYLSFVMLDRLGMPNLFSTRFVSFDESSGTGSGSLRVDVMKTEDIREAAPVVLENRDALAGQLSSSIAHECITDQKHTSNVYVVTPEDLGPVWPKEKPPHRRNVDGLVTDIPDVLLTAFGGDCPPVFLADPVKKATGLVHSGWRGTLGRISAAAIELMKDRFGCAPGDIYAAIGPGICADCYEMGDEVYDIFAKEWGVKYADRVMRKYPAFDNNGNEITGGRYHLDLREAIYTTLTEAGISKDHIAVSNVCTKCNVNAFYSYRAGRLENEQAAMIVNRFSK